MTVVVTLAEVLHLAPSARSSYRVAFTNGQSVLDDFGISAAALRVIHFVAQVLHESSGLTVQFENLNYSPERLAKVWPSRFKPKGPLDPNDYAHNPQKLANEVYGNRMGNTGPTDGYAYRGRGLLQLTGRAGYARVTESLRQRDPAAPDLVASPDEVISSQWCLAAAAADWFSKGCNAMADADNIGAITRAINGGLIGLTDRTEWAKRARAVWQSPTPTPIPKS